MKTKISKNAKPLIRLKLTKNDGNVLSVSFRKKMKIYSICKEEDFSEYDLEVVYLPGISNSGKFNSKIEMLEAFSNWTEKPLLDYIYEGDWE